MQGTELVVTATLCLGGEILHISMRNSYPAFARTLILVCGQRMEILTFFKEDYYV